MSLPSSSAASPLAPRLIDSLTCQELQEALDNAQPITNLDDPNQPATYWLISYSSHLQPPGFKVKLSPLSYSISASLRHPSPSCFHLLHTLILSQNPSLATSSLSLFSSFSVSSSSPSPLVVVTALSDPGHPQNATE
ncbi:hypothetical protein EDB92DRAFT_1944990 [Lactarius akahatsu]|uniref:Uncharacterized protein n=1 Tax=Lactarius akahatsu TaxID=416441 RepID=A0AAD4LHC8_9AGAM|nr:hypothetical protein EDB92DRAFT_1944990 [Lactarius akahatsu]